MNHDSPRARRREATLDRIVTAALALVGREGLGGLTMQRVATAVDYTPGALYRYFPSKGALIGELNRRVLVRTQQAVVDAWDALPPPPADDPVAALAPLWAASEALLTEARDRPDAFAVIAATMGEPTRLVPDDHDAVHLPVLATFLGTLAARIDAAVAAGALADGPGGARAVRWVFGLVGVLQLTKIADRDPRLVPWPLARGLTLDLLRGWGADDAVVATLLAADGADP